MPNKIKKTSPTPKAASKKPAAPAKKTVAKASTRKSVAKPAPKPATKAAPAPAKAKAKPAVPAAKPAVAAAKPPVAAAKPPIPAAKPPIPAAKPSAAKPEPVKAVPMAAKPAAKPEPAKAAAKAAPAAKAVPVQKAVSAVKAVPAPKAVPAVAAAPAPAPVKKAPSRPLAFTTGDHVVYPTHGVGQITEIEEREVAGMKLTLYVVTFDKDKMTLRVPVAKVEASGMRKLSTPKIMETAMATLKGRARIKRTMWSRRAQEYEAKINSGDPISIAEVVRDLHRSASQPEQSYSERQIYEAALDRLVREIAAVENIDENAATERLHKVLKVA